MLICGQRALFSDHITWLIISETSLYEIFCSHNKIKNSDTLTALVNTVQDMQNVTTWKERTFAGKLT